MARSPLALAVSLLASASAALAGCSSVDESRAGWSVYQERGHCEAGCDLLAKSGRGAFNLSFAWDVGASYDLHGFYSSDLPPGTYLMEWSGPRAERVEVSVKSLDTPCGELALDHVQATAGADRCTVRLDLDGPLLANGSTTLRWGFDRHIWTWESDFEPEGPREIRFNATRPA